MADLGRADEVLKRLVDANLRWYEGFGRVTADYAQALSKLWTDAALGIFTPKTTHATAAPASPPAAPRPASLVLEAELGQVAQGVLMVENRLARAVTADVVTSAFSSETGAEVRPVMRVQPGSVTLEPGARTLVQVSAMIDERLEPGGTYRGEVSVPGLSDTPIPIVLRRQHTTADRTPVPADRDAAVDVKPARAGRAGSRKRTRSK